MNNEDFFNELKEFAVVCVGLCLGKLVELEKATRDQLNQPWYIEFNSEKLGKKNLAGGVTLDGFCRPVIYLPANLTLEGIMRILAHETVHLMQICKED